jgi:hypothetical protein
MDAVVSKPRAADYSLSHPFAHHGGNSLTDRPLALAGGHRCCPDQGGHTQPAPGSTMVCQTHTAKRSPEVEPPHQ